MQDATLVVIGALGLFWAVFWPLTLTRALSHHMTNAFFGVERRLRSAELRRFVLSCLLLMAAALLGQVLLAPQGKHPHPEFRQTVGLVRLLAVCIMSGLGMAGILWFILSVQARRLAKFHRPNPSTWQGLAFWGPKKRKMTPEERIACLRQMDFADYLEALAGFVFNFAMLPFFS